MAAVSTKSFILLCLLFVFSALIIVEISAAEASTTIDDDNINGGVFHEVPDDSSSLKIELDQLKSKLSSLESSVGEKIHELKVKDGSIKTLEKIIQEKSTSLALLQSQIQSLQEKGSLDAKEQSGEANTRVEELEKQVGNLKKEIELQNKKKDELSARADVAEKKFQELSSNLEKLHKVNADQKDQIRATEYALQLAEEEMMKAKLEASYTSKKLIEVKESWLPPWLAAHFVHYQSIIVTQWKELGRPTLDLTIQKALEKKAQVENWAEPHIHTVSTKWIPLIRERFSVFVSEVKPLGQALSAKLVEIYHASWNSLQPQLVKVRKTLSPYIQEAKKFTKPYVDGLSTIAKPHVDKAQVILKPYTKKVHYSYKKFVRIASVFHRQLQGTIQETLKSHEFTTSLATKQLVWYLATALMALPVIPLFNIASSIFCKKPKKRVQSSTTRHRVKRVHHDKHVNQEK